MSELAKPRPSTEARSSTAMSPVPVISTSSLASPKARQEQQSKARSKFKAAMDEESYQKKEDVQEQEDPFGNLNSIRHVDELEPTRYASTKNRSRQASFSIHQVKGGKSGKVSPKSQKKITAKNESKIQKVYQKRFQYQRDSLDPEKESKLRSDAIKARKIAHLSSKNISGSYSA